MVISKKEISALKAICISLIIVHNVVHNRLPLSGNEFSFSQEWVDYFLSNFLVWKPAIWRRISMLFCFYGWMGVSLFVFASGYGLSIKYEKQFHVWQYIKRNYLKFFILLLPAYAIFLIIQACLGGVYYNGINIILEQFMLINIFNPHDIEPGLYWYIGMAFQLYLLFIPLSKLSNKYLLSIAVFVCLLLAFLPSEYVCYLRKNSIGWLPEFIFGIMVRRKEFSVKSSFRAVYALLMGGGTILFTFSRYTFMLSGVCFICLLLLFKEQISESRCLCYIGSVSASMYVVQGVARQLVSYLPKLIDGYYLPSPLMHGLLVLIITFLCSVPYQMIYQKICRMLKDNSVIRS